MTWRSSADHDERWRCCDVWPRSLINKWNGREYAVKYGCKVPALYWHEWVEAFVGEWTQMDPTFNQVVADATHFGVGQEGNAEITPLIGQLKVTEVK